ncbi:unnamed protein product [Brachionus calyciflorus]|uniref:Glutamate [NMDA] receptor subunit 1 n=1 Tax=Brachionus calyciflorus TaxID=104777 RepID=A0A813M8L7_9BILA|nr:unnamed protein product [Brachionus calyciflorus]
MKIFKLLIFTLVYKFTNSSKQTTDISVGYVYCEPEELIRAEGIVNELNNEIVNMNSKSRARLILRGLQLKPNENTISLSLSICQNLINHNPIYAVIVGKSHCLVDKEKTTEGLFDNDYISTLSAVAFTCAYYQIPIIDLYSRDATYSDKSIFSTYVRMSPPYFHQANIWLEIVREFDWKSVNIIHSINTEGKMLAAKFQYLADHHDVKIANEFEYNAGRDNYNDLISKLVQSNSKVYLLQAEPKDAYNILKQAEENDLLTSGNVWITNDQILSNKTFSKLTNGVLIAEYVEGVENLFYSLAIIKKAYETLYPYQLKKPPLNCSDNGLEWDLGRKIYEEIIFNMHEFDDKKIEFDDDGDRISTYYNIINLNNNKKKKVGEFTLDSKSMNLKIDSSLIVWPGNFKHKPDGTKWSSKFKIVVIEEKPFIFKIPKPDNKKCSEFINNSYDCPWSYKNKSRNFCCYGYCIDLIKKISDKLDFDYELYLAPDGLYGDLDTNKQWNGLMGELVSERADLILAPFTINPERAQYVDFTKPFKYQGITILVKRKGSDSSLVSFLQPFKDGLWVIILLSVHIVALVLYLLDRFSPFGRFKLSKTENTEEDALNLSRALWFTWGVLLNSGIGEGTPRSFSARVLGMVWAGFTMIMVASYTANLAAFLVLDRPEASITGINDARLRNPSDNFSYASVKGSAVERYFKRQVELSTMYRTMENKNYNTAEDAIEDLRNDKIQAFIWDSARLEYEARKSCDFITTGELFGRSSYALALKKGNPWLQKISLNILTLHENGFIEDLDKEWILLNNTSCQIRDSSPSTLGLTNMAGVFMLVAGGIIVGIFLIFIEIAYKKRKDKKVRQHDISRNAFATWRKNVEKRKLRATQGSFNEGTRHEDGFLKIPISSHYQKINSIRTEPRKTNFILDSEEIDPKIKMNESKSLNRKLTKTPKICD